jgi:hypothetical protein
LRSLDTRLRHLESHARAAETPTHRYIELDLIDVPEAEAQRRIAEAEAVAKAEGYRLILIEGSTNAYAEP